MLLNPEIQSAYEAEDYVGAVELLRQDLSQVGATTSSGSTLLHKAILGEKAWFAGELLKLGLNINTPDQHGRTPLHEACCYGNLAMVDFLVEHGADLNGRDHDGATPLMRAIASSVGDRPAIAQRLIDSGATADLTSAVRVGSIENVQNHVDRNPDCIRQHPDSTSLLVAAIQRQDSGMLELLLSAGAAVNGVDEFGWHPLSYACYVHGRQINVDLIRLFLDHGANPSVVVRPAQASLLSYVERVLQRSDIARLLQERGAIEE